MSDNSVDRIYEILDASQDLVDSDNPFVCVSAERIGAIVADVLLELDPGNFTNPWDALPAAKSDR